ncbi:ribonuclease III [Thermoflavifilum thermophilum]|uniref:Ribonuclease 3 n=1 Tax=Thermoflavifilum thermophilum TaxID=1393122 RepID=A0A1I7NDX2_9BACT|nr:ribonuclease III [Thermoflavifilum thermophilum]SFV32763.1 ribonuclease-3 [Thermoflavifilum thermophilum]
MASIRRIWSRWLGVNENRQLKKALKQILGFTPHHLKLYETALSHRSITEHNRESNERLEYLGDAVLGAIVGDYLYHKYPGRSEGYLTEMRSKMVNRQQLNEIAIKMGLRKLVHYDKYNSLLKISHIFGNALEALVGAIYLDKGYDKTRQFVYQSIIAPYMDMEALEHTEINHKNKLYGWANKYGHQLEFELIEEEMKGARKVFTVAAVVDGKIISTGKAYNKKDAGQIAAKLALEKLGLNEHHSSV